MVAVVLGSGIVFLDTSVVNLALPRIGQDLASSHFGTLEAESYVSNAYFVTLASMLILAGALNDYYGRRRRVLAGARRVRRAGRWRGRIAKPYRKFLDSLLQKEQSPSNEA